jgi:hypothetical protein
MNNTGNNTASFNTGGDTNITTGNANAGIDIFNTAGSNEAYVVSPSYYANAAEIAILGNGAFSDNSVNASQYNKTSVNQKNHTMFDNTVNTKNNTGKNKSDYGTGFESYMPYYNAYGNSDQYGNGYGSGMSSVYSGDANAGVGMYNLASSNRLSSY